MANSTPTIIDTILSDITGVIPNFSSLVSAYRLLVGAAEEIHRTPGVPFEIFERAVIRYDRAGTLIDIFLELLCCKIAFSSQFLAVTCAPVDIIRLLADCGTLEDDACHTAEQIIILELLRQVLDRHCHDYSCFGPPPEGITPPRKPTPPTPPANANSCTNLIQSDLESTKELETEVTHPVTSSFYKYTSPLSRRHI